MKPKPTCQNRDVPKCRRKCCRKPKGNLPKTGVQTRIDWSGLSPREQLDHWRNRISGNDEKS